MSNGNVINLRERLLRPIRLRMSRAPEAPEILITHYQRAAIREDVPVTLLAAALATHGLTFTVDPDIGVIIHPMAED